MKVIYNTCFADPWIKVAEKLLEENNFEPVYWIGYNFDNSEELVSIKFPNAIYHSYYNAWKGIFPECIEQRANKTNINIDFLNKYSSEELLALRMMDRMDNDRYSFSFIERQRHFRKFVKYWIASIELLEPDLIISAVIPHRVYDYALYLVAKYYNIKYLTFCTSAFLGHILPIDKINSININIGDYYEKIYKDSKSIDTIKQEINDDVYKRYQIVSQKNAIARPFYMSEHEKRQKKSSLYHQLSKKILKVVTGKHSRTYFGENGVLTKGFPSYHKQRNISIEKSKSTIYGNLRDIIQATLYKTKLSKHYESLTTKFDEKENYIILFLHYQPEMTTNPSGGIFVDQMLCVDLLLKNMPHSYKLYIKEHPTQFYNHTEGHTSRIKEFYDDLVKYPQVRLISTKIDSFELIKKSKAVATVTGTVGWEAMVFRKPVIIFGITWYEKYKGVLKVNDEESASRITKFIKNYKFDERDLLSYLAAFSLISTKAYYYRGIKEITNQSESQCINNLCEVINKIK